LLRQMIGERELLLGDVLLEHHALQRAGAIAHEQKVQLAARALVVQPALERHRLRFMLADVLDVDPRSLTHTFRIARAAARLACSGARTPGLRTGWRPGRAAGIGPARFMPHR